jgi:hypothetical protein
MLENRVDGPVSDYKKIDYFYLPLPSKIEETYDQSFEENRYSLEEKMFKKGVGAANALAANVSRNIPTLFNDLIGLTETYLKRDNIVVNQNIIHTYRGSNPRTISLNFQFIPENKPHADKIIEMINLIKEYARAEMFDKNISATNTKSDGVGDGSTKGTDGQPLAAPSTTAGTPTAKTTASGVSTTPDGADFSASFLKQKHIFTFEISVDKNSADERININKLNAVMSSKHLTSSVDDKGKEQEIKLKKGASPVSSGYFIQAINFDYGVDGNMSMYNDGMPKQINLTLSLIERIPMWADNFKSNYDKLNGASNKVLFGTLI